MLKINIPLSVPKQSQLAYQKNYAALTNNSGNLLLIAGDQKIEHLNDDFFGAGITPEDASPEHLFKIAAGSKGGVLATQLGLVAQYGKDYQNIPYIIKLNGKTNIGINEEKNSSHCLWEITDVLNLKKQSGLKIIGIGYTLYLGGKYEAEMLATAAKAINEAHQNGLTAILWVYPRGKYIKEEDIHTIAGGAGVAACLGADFVKVKYPYSAKDKTSAAQKFNEVVLAAGKTKIICVGGTKRTPKEILDDLEKQITISKTAGIAIGRNLHQRSLGEVNRLNAAMGAIIFKGAKAKAAYSIYLNKKNPENKKTTKFLGLF